MKVLHKICAITTLALGLAAAALSAQAADTFITVASTTSTAASGLFDHILPKFQEKTGIQVRVVAVGTGQAIRMARNGDADVLLVHHKPSEERFVADGLGVKRHGLMYNDFVIVGPKDDPAGVRGMNDAEAALSRIAKTQAPFASRGDDSGTHKKERELWSKAGIDVEAASGHWYRETGSGMGRTLNVAAAMDAYTLTDRATWLSFENKQNLELVVQGHKDLYNQYGVILVSPDKFPHVKADLGQTFIDWLISNEGQQAIASFKVGGEQLFFPNANDAGS